MKIEWAQANNTNCIEDKKVPPFRVSFLDRYIERSYNIEVNEKTEYRSSLNTLKS